MVLFDSDEISPWAWWTDERIRNWAYSRHLNRYPKATVPLISVRPDMDAAIIHFDRPGCPVERIKDQRSTCEGARP